MCVFKGSILKTFAIFGFRINARLEETFRIPLLDTISMREPKVIALYYVIMFLIIL